MRGILVKSGEGEKGDTNRRLDSARTHSSQFGRKPSASPLAVIPRRPTFTAIACRVELVRSLLEGAG